MVAITKSPARVAIAAAALTAAADLLAYGAVPGASYSILIAVIVSAILLFRPRRRFDIPGTAFCILLGAIALQFVIQPSVCGFFLGFLLLFALSFWAAQQYQPGLVDFLRRSVISAAAGIFVSAGDLLGWAKGGTRRRRFPLPRWWVIAVPVFLVLVFGMMLAGANPVFSSWVESASDVAWDNLKAAFERVNMLRFLFWVLFFAGAFGIIRMRWRASGSPEPKQPQLYVYRVDPHAQYLSCMVSMVCLNALFVVVNLVDIIYLWFSASLPEGVTYARYAHTGSNRLIVTVILSAIVICVFYRRQTVQAHSRLARLLVHVWVLQNMFLILSAFRRLLIYIDAYGLTRWRIAAALWMALVFCGFVLVILKIARNWGAPRLIRANIVSTLILFFLVGFFNMDALIADYNVERYLTGKTKLVDVSYLASLDYNALPAMARLKKSTDPGVVTEASLRLRAATARLKEQAADWRSYQWRRSRVLASLENPGQ